MNIFGIINSIAKMKASIGAIISDDKELLEKSKFFYFRNSLVFSESEDEEKYQKSVCSYRNFLEKDERAEWHINLTKNGI